MPAEEKTEVASGAFIGLSFGTLYSTICIVGKDGLDETIANEDGHRNIPSCVAYTSHDELVGTQAKLQAIRNPRNTIVHFRNLLAREYPSSRSNALCSFEHADVAAHQKEHRLSIVPSLGNSSEPAYEIDSWESEDPDAEPTKRLVTPLQITQTFLEGMKVTAEHYLGREVLGCVISDPTSFDKAQTDALVTATKNSGFKHVFTIKEPVAAALSFEKESAKIDKKVLVLDFGGHNFNVSLLSSNKGVYTILASEDDFKLGGVHLDEILVGLVADEFKRKTRMDLRENRRSLMKLRTACEQTKRALSQRDMAPCSVESLYEGMDHTGTINRGRFDALAEPLFQRCASLIKKTLEKNKVAASELDSVILVGGSSKVPRYQAVVKGLFPEGTVFHMSSDPDESISMGCNIQARLIQEVGVSEYTEACLNEKLTRGIAYTCKDIGIADADGNMCVIIPRSVPVPCLRTVHFSNAVKGQEELFMALYEGDNAKVSKNSVLAEVVLSGIPKTTEVGECDLEVSFSIEKDMTLHVFCKEKKSGKTLQCDIKKH
ncbi:MAG: hypothetical protein SGCHY_004516 [Lobulomycetales sp.]